MKIKKKSKKNTKKADKGKMLHLVVNRESNEIESEKDREKMMKMKR